MGSGGLVVNKDIYRGEAMAPLYSPAADDPDKSEVLFPADGVSHQIKKRKTITVVTSTGGEVVVRKTFSDRGNR